MDRLTPQQRHKTMAAIRNKDTKPEMIVRRGLWKRGFRYRLNHKRLLGHPDLVLRKYRTCIFVNGCFWHGHRHCTKFHVPSTHVAFWRHKFAKNRKRDQQNISALLDLGYRVCVVWECSITGSNQSQKLDNIAGEIALWLEEGLATPYIEW